MALTREQSQIWQAMNVGVQWVLRDGIDPLAPEPKPAASAAPAEVKPSAVSPSATIPAGSAPAAPAMVRRGPMATRLRRQQAAAGIQSTPAATTAIPAASAAGVQSLKPVAAATIAPRPGLRPVAPPRPQSAAASQVQADAQLVAELRTARWEDIKGIADRCRVCPMAAERTNTVVADGAPGCPIVMVGEAPGREEDLSGIPFVGNSGKLLTEILKACSLERGKDVAICNVLKCRPPGNRDPKPDEVAACAAFLDRQLDLLQPKLLVLMGKHAVWRLLGEAKPISQMRGHLYEVQIAGRKVPAVVTYHPSYLLRNPVAKELGWHDILFAKKNVPQD